MKRVLNKIKLRLPAIVLLAVTVLFWGLYDHYEADGPVLLESPVLADAFRVRGDVVETNGVFTLSVPAGGSTAEVRFQLPGAVDYSYVRICGRIRTKDVVRGKNTWNSARFLLIQRKATKEWIAAHHHLHSEYGTTDWSWDENDFEIRPQAAFCELVLQHSGKSGRADFDQITIQPVRIRDSYTWFRIAFALAWLIMGFRYFKQCRLDHRRLRILIILNVLAILYGTLIPGYWLSNVSEDLKRGMSEWVKKSPPVHSDTVPQDVEKKPDRQEHAESKRIDQIRYMVGKAHLAGHFVLFATLCFLVYCSAWLENQHPIYYLKVGLDILLFAAVSESLQFLTLDRVPGLHDWLVDVYGMALALGLFVVVRIIAAFFPTSGKA